MSDFQTVVDPGPQLDRSVLATVESHRPPVRPTRLLQFGTGRFLLGFLGDFIDRANRRSAFDGRAVAVQSTGGDRAEAINRQDGAYTLVTRGVEAGRIVEERRILDCLQGAIAAQEQWQAALDVARDPALAVVVSNTTENGLALDPDDRPDSPKSYPARLTAALIERHRALGRISGSGLAILPCELLEGNAELLQRNVSMLARAWGIGGGFHEWLARECRFCNTLVDRIVTGRPPNAERREWRRKLGYEDALLTIAEPYALWAIEGDESVRERIGFARANRAIVVAPDISMHRELKLRILNGAHTACAALGLLLGHRTIIDAMRDAVFCAFMQELLRKEIAPTLPFDAGRVHAYIEQVLDRFRNPSLRHALSDIATNYTVKVRSRLVPIICGAAARGGKAPRLALGFAAYLCLLRMNALSPPAFERRAADGTAEPIVELWRRAGQDASSDAVRRTVANILRNDELWGVDLAAQAEFSGLVADFLLLGSSRGFRAALRQTMIAVE